MRNVHKNLVETPQRNRPLKRHMRTLEDNIKMDPKGLGCEDVV